MRQAHYSTTQRYLHHKPRPEHAQALEDAFRETIVPFSGPARDPSTSGGLPAAVGFGSMTGIEGKAPTRIELVYTALQAAA